MLRFVLFLGNSAGSGRFGWIRETIGAMVNTIVPWTRIMGSGIPEMRLGFFAKGWTFSRRFFRLRKTWLDSYNHM